MSDPLSDSRARLEAVRQSMPADGVPATGPALEMWKLLLSNPGVQPTAEQVKEAASSQQENPQ